MIYKRGYTFIELMIYITLSVIFFGFVFLFINNISYIIEREVIVAELDSKASHGVERVTEILSNAILPIFISGESSLANSDYNRQISDFQTGRTSDLNHMLNHGTNGVIFHPVGTLRGNTVNHAGFPIIGSQGPAPNGSGIVEFFSNYYDGLELAQNIPISARNKILEIPVLFNPQTADFILNSLRIGPNGGSAFGYKFYGYFTDNSTTDFYLSNYPRGLNGFFPSYIISSLFFSYYNDFSSRRDALASNSYLRIDESVIDYDLNGDGDKEDSFVACKLVLKNTIGDSFYFDKNMNIQEHHPSPGDSRYVRTEEILGPMVLLVFDNSSPLSTSAAYSNKNAPFSLVRGVSGSRNTVRVKLLLCNYLEDFVIGPSGNSGYIATGITPKAKKRGGPIVRYYEFDVVNNFLGTD